MDAKPKTIDEYLATVGEDKRAALEKLRKTIKAAAPRAEECISYGLAAFRLDGMLVGFGATAKHCAFYLMSASTVEAFSVELAGYDTSKGTIRFSPDTPLPVALVRKLVKARIAENAELLKAKKQAHEGSQSDPSVDAFLLALDHPLKAEVEAVRRIILGVSPTIREGIKWKAPSFRVTDDFATFHLRAVDRVQLIFHTGAKVKASATTGVKIADPAGLLEWLAKDRALVTLGTGNDIQAKSDALRALVREWIGQLGSS